MFYDLILQFLEKDYKNNVNMLCSQAKTSRILFNYLFITLFTIHQIVLFLTFQWWFCFLMPSFKEACIVECWMKILQLKQTTQAVCSLDLLQSVIFLFVQYLNFQTKYQIFFNYMKKTLKLIINSNYVK